MHTQKMILHLMSALKKNAIIFIQNYGGGCGHPNQCVAWHCPFHSISQIQHHSNRQRAIMHVICIQPPATCGENKIRCACIVASLIFRPLLAFSGLHSHVEWPEDKVLENLRLPRGGWKSGPNFAESANFCMCTTCNKFAESA